MLDVTIRMNGESQEVLDNGDGLLGGLRLSDMVVMEKLPDDKFVYSS